VTGNSCRRVGFGRVAEVEYLRGRRVNVASEQGDVVQSSPCRHADAPTRVPYRPPPISRIAPVM
jgi:hypothetical protein